MRIDISEPECSTCFHNRTSGVVNPRVPEPLQIAPSITSTPVSSEPVHDSAAAVASTSASSSPAHSSSPHGSVRFSFGPDSSAPTQAHGLTTSGSMQAPDSSAAPTPSVFGSTQPPSGLFGPKPPSGLFAPTPSIFGSTQPPSGLFGPKPPSGLFAPTPSIFGSTQPSSGLFGPKPSTSPAFGSGGASATFTSPPPFGFSPAIYNRTHPVNSASTQPFGSNTPPSLWSAQAPSFGSSGFAAPTPSPFGRSMEAPAFGSSGFAAPTPSPFGSSKQAPAFGFGSGVASATSTSSTSSPARSPFSFPSLHRNGVDVTSTTGHSAPVQASEPSPSRCFSFGPAQDLGKTASPPPPSLFRNGVGCFARPDVGTSPSVNTSSTTVVFGTTPVSVSSSVGPTNPFSYFPKTGFAVPKNPFSSLFPGFGVDYLPGTPSNVFRVNPPSTTPVSGGGPVTSGVNTSRFPVTSTSQPSGFNTFSSNHNTGSPVFATHQWDVRERGTGNPRYAPTPCTDPSGGNLISISASFSYQDKSHEELRWEDHKKGDKGGSFPADPITRFQGAQRPHETNAVSSPASGCTACGATSSSSASGYSGSNVATTPPSAVTSLPGFSCPMMYGTTNLAAQGTTTTPAFQAYPTMFGANHAAQGTTTTPAFQAYPTMFDANLAAQSTTTTPAFQAYPTMFGAAQSRIAALLQAYPTMYGTNFAAQGTTPAPLQAYPTMYGTNAAAQGTTTTPGLQAYPMMYGANAGAQGTTTTPGLQAYPTMYGTNAGAQGTTTTPGLQAYPMMYGTNIAVQVTTPPGQAYPVHGLIILPFAAMNLQ